MHHNDRQGTKERNSSNNASAPRFNSGSGKFPHDITKATVLRPQPRPQAVRPRAGTMAP